MNRRWRDRIDSGQRSAWRCQVGYVAGGAVHEVDGLLVTLTNLPDDELNTGFVEREPADPDSAIARAEEWCEEQGQRLAIDMDEGRHPAVERAAERAGLRPVVRRPGMAASVSEIPMVRVLTRLDIGPVETLQNLEGFVAVQVEAFGMARSVAERFLPATALAAPGVTYYLGLLASVPVATATAFLHDGALGIFGVATATSARGRGVGTAITAHAIREHRDRADLAWLHATRAGRSMYERMGFRTVSDWVVWTRPS